MLFAPFFAGLLAQAPGTWVVRAAPETPAVGDTLRVAMPTRLRTAAKVKGRGAPLLPGAVLTVLERGPEAFRGERQGSLLRVRASSGLEGWVFGPDLCAQPITVDLDADGNPDTFVAAFDDAQHLWLRRVDPPVAVDLGLLIEVSPITTAALDLLSAEAAGLPLLRVDRASPDGGFHQLTLLSATPTAPLQVALGWTSRIGGRASQEVELRLQPKKGGLVLLTTASTTRDEGDVREVITNQRYTLQAGVFVPGEVSERVEVRR